MARLLTSFFGLGRLPLAPGTWGSLTPTFIFAILCLLTAPSVWILTVMAAFVLAGAIICVKFAPDAIAATGKNDPREVVADEVAGQALTFFLLSLFIEPVFSTKQVWIVAALGFFIFRVFDILKPWPIHRLEKLPQGWGILADDLLAGVYAGVVLLICHRLGWIGYLSKQSYFTGTISFFQAIALGAVQGLTEFIPVSSSGHSVLLETIFNLKPETPEMLLFDLATHLGTLVSIFVVFREAFTKRLKCLWVEGHGGSSLVQTCKQNSAVHLLLLVTAATVVTGVLGMLFKKQFISSRGSIQLLSLMWIINGTVLLVSDYCKKTPLSLQQFPLSRAALVGLAQAVAIFPGVSRGGSTISIAILLGLARPDAIEFSFMLAIPAILGAATLQFADYLKGPGSDPSGLLCSAVTGAVIAAIMGVVALKILIRVLQAARLRIFAFYCYVLACLVIIVYLATRS